MTVGGQLFCAAGAIFTITVFVLCWQVGLVLLGATLAAVYGGWWWMHTWSERNP